MKRTLASTALLFALYGHAHAAGFSDPLPHYERKGNSFDCQMAQADFDKIRASNFHADACLRIGPLEIGVTRTEAEKILGQPVTSGTSGAQTYFGYALKTDNTGNVITYVAIIYANDGTAASIQVTGQPWSNPWRFSGLTLGDSPNALRARLGAPLQTEPSSEAGTTLWLYEPWKFSFEIHANKITSIRVEKDNT